MVVGAHAQPGQSSAVRPSWEARERRPIRAVEARFPLLPIRDQAPRCACVTRFCAQQPMFAKRLYLAPWRDRGERGGSEAMDAERRFSI